MDKLKNLQNLKINYAWNITESGYYHRLTWEKVMLECAQLLSSSEGLFAFFVDRDGAVEVMSTEEGEILLSPSMEVGSLEFQSLIKKVNEEERPFLLFVADEDNLYAYASNNEIFLMRGEEIER